MLATFQWSALGWASLAFFLFVLAIGLGFALLRLGETLGRLSSLIRGTEHELVPVIAKVGGSVDRVNGQLDKMDVVTDSAVDAVESVDTAVRAVSFAVTTPVKKATGWTAGLRHGGASLKATRDWRAAVQEAKDAAARREADLVDELRRTGAGGGPGAGSSAGSTPLNESGGGSVSAE